jgi:hypothetical protein
MGKLIMCPRTPLQEALAEVEGLLETGDIRGAAVSVTWGVLADAETPIRSEAHKLTMKQRRTALAECLCKVSEVIDRVAESIEVGKIKS